MLRDRLQQFMQKAQMESGYLPVITPHIGLKDLYVTSGHYEKYGKDSFQPIKTPHEGEEFYLKPMNCPHHCEIYKSSPRSYKDLPLRYAEFGTVYRYEQHGELHDSQILHIRWDVIDRTIEIALDDMHANFLGLPEYEGARPIVILFRAVEDVSLNCDSRSGDRQCIYGIEIQENHSPKTELTIFLWPSGRLQFSCEAIFISDEN